MPGCGNVQGLWVQLFLSTSSCEFSILSKALFPSGSCALRPCAQTLTQHGRPASVYLGRRVLAQQRSSVQSAGPGSAGEQAASHVWHHLDHLTGASCQLPDHGRQGQGPQQQGYLTGAQSLKLQNLLKWSQFSCSIQGSHSPFQKSLTAVFLSILEEFLGACLPFDYTHFLMKCMSLEGSCFEIVEPLLMNHSH